MDSSDSRLTIAVLSQNNRTIGLFEHIRVTTMNGSFMNNISYFKPSNNPIQQFVGARVVIEYDMDNNEVHTEHIGVAIYNINELIVNEPMPIAIQTATLFRLPFQASFWETEEHYPVYTMNPDYLLPWGSTLVCMTQMPAFTTYQHRHYRLQTTPVSSPPPSPQASPRRVGTMKRTLSSTAVCPITLGSLTMGSVFWTPCGHAFSSAIEEALRRDPRCPMCRSGCRFKDCAVPS